MTVDHDRVGRDELIRLNLERTCAIELLAAARSCAIAEAQQLVMARVDEELERKARRARRRG